MRIGPYDLGRDLIIVAEIGNNHEGNIKLARELVRRAAECGVDAVKFQTFRTEHYVGRNDAERFAQLKSFELSEAEFAELAALARSLRLLFFSTAFDLASAKFLAPIVDAFKVASGDNTFYPLLAAVARTGRPVIVSTGATELPEICRSVDFIRREQSAAGSAAPIAVLHCVSSYPVPPEQVNLRAIPYLADHLGVPVGYSDHTAGVDAAPAAVALGAHMVEKHFTLDHEYSSFRDHALSADPCELTELVRRCRSTAALLGSAEKRVQPAEAGMAVTIRRSIVAAEDLARGRRIALTDLTWVRPAGGLPPGREDALLGRVLRRAVAAGERLQEADVE